MSVISLDDARKKLGKRTASGYQSTQSTTSDKAGQTHTDLDEETEKSLVDLYQVLKEAQINSFTTKSKFSRTWANVIAMAASEGLISTRASSDIWGNRWHVTEDGDQFIEELEDVID